MKPATVAALMPATRCWVDANLSDPREESVYRSVRTLHSGKWRAIATVVGCHMPVPSVIEQVALQLAAEYLLEEDRHTIPDMPVLLPSGVWH